MNELLEFALKYANLGWYVFPIVPGQKNPLTKHGVKDASNHPDVIKAWWEKWPKANIGLACGEKSGVYVIDIDLDKEKGIDGYKTYKEIFGSDVSALPKTVRQDTPRGGFHAFYKTNNPPTNKNNWHPGIDIRGGGYYILLAPSIHPNGGTYTWTARQAPRDIKLAEYPNWMRPPGRIPWGASSAHNLESSLPGTNPITSVQRCFRNNKLKRASLYLNECDPAIQGCGGHDRLLWAAVAMVHGFQLSNEEALALLEEEYNPRCVPPWDLSESQDRKDFQRKIPEARKLKPKHPPGWLLNDDSYQMTMSIPAEVSAGADFMIRKFREIPPISESELEYLQKPPGLVGDICEWINRTALKKQPFLTLACTLTFCGSLFGRKVKDSLGSRTNLYCMGVALSSAGKAHAPNQIRKLCEHAGCLDLLGGDEAASDAAIECRLERNPSTLFLWDEIGLFLSYIQSGSNPHVSRIVFLLMKLYSAAGTIYKGREYAEQDKQRTIVQPCCCIYGFSTPERFQEGITHDELQDGWLSRTLIFSASENPPKTRNNLEIPIPPDISDTVNLWYSREIGKSGGNIESFTAFQSRTGSILGKPPEQILVETSQGAERIFIELDDKSIKIGVENPNVACLWAKAEENARKISLILAAGVDFERPFITSSIANYSCRLVEYLLVQFIDNTIPCIVSSQTDHNKQKILKIIEDTGTKGCKARTITRKARWSNARQRKELLYDLIEGEEVVSAQKSDDKAFYFWTAENYQKFLKNGKC
ncbi:hypothetical protein LCGC14_1066540 [marine sediment metagenome]|uniref:DNA primase/polymerase bifunctional N-terminal domain-containing protein n=1 Tax=marine sediment metagenome TaxID=412755 RepID=A0A0F9MJI3_9ZZZZ